VGSSAENSSSFSRRDVMSPNAEIQKMRRHLVRLVLVAQDKTYVSLLLQVEEEMRKRGITDDEHILEITVQIWNLSMDKDVVVSPELAFWIADASGLGARHCRLLIPEYESDEEEQVFRTMLMYLVNLRGQQGKT